MTRVDRVADQLAIHDTKPDDAGSSPTRHHHYVVVPRDDKPDTLRSEKDVLASGNR
jgi:hypothetical protein